jgi:acylphosphatase
MKRVQFLIRGRVQGVYFRASTQAIGAALGVSGYVRNLPDGRVEVLAEGSEEQLQALYDYCTHGPEGARVDHIEVHHFPAQGDLARPFTVAR